MGCRCSIKASVRRGLNEPQFKPWHSFATSYNQCSADMVRVEYHKTSQMPRITRSIISSKHSCQHSSIPRLKKRLKHETQGQRIMKRHKARELTKVNKMWITIPLSSCLKQADIPKEDCCIQAFQDCQIPGCMNCKRKSKRHKMRGSLRYNAPENVLGSKDIEEGGGGGGCHNFLDG